MIYPWIGNVSAQDGKEYSKFPYLYNFYGTILDKQNKFDEAILVYKTAIKLKKDDAFINYFSSFTIIS